MRSIFATRKGWLTLTIAFGVAAIAWWQHEPILAWYYVRHLACADEDNRERWATKVAGLEEAALPRLLEGLQDRDEIVCTNLQLALLIITKKWGLADPRTGGLIERSSASFAKFSPAGQEKTLQLLTALLQTDVPRPLSPRLTKTVGDMLVCAEKKNELRAASLLLAAELVVCVEPGQWVEVAREMAERGLKDETAGCRVAALRLLLREPMRREADLLEKAIPLLRDPVSAVRKTALLVLASESELVREESFLPLLHDDDAEVQYLCEVALRKRKLTDDDIKIARMISDRDPATRMRALSHLHRVPDLNVAGLVRQLSQDAIPAVRAAAARAVAENPQIELSDRLREMAGADPSDAVRQIAHYYLHQRPRRPGPD